MDKDNCGMATKCVHSGIKDDPTGAVVTPIYQTSTFKFRDADHGARLFKGEEQGYIYTRMRNPTIEAMEDAIAALEGGAKAIGCASGMAAIHLLFSSVLSASEHVICSEAVYGPTISILQNLFAKYGIESSIVDTSDISSIKSSIQNNTKLIFIETPGNPSLVISDIQAISEIAKSINAKLAVDNTFMSPVLQQPFKFGADYVIHSLTKFLNGHADVIGGVLVLKEESEYSHFRKMSNLIGGVIDPFNAFLVHRGIKTLHIRMQKHCENAKIITEYLKDNPKVAWVNYPGDASHPQYEIARKQMIDFGGMIAFELKDGLEAGKRLMNNVRVWQLAVSLGGVESLIQHPATMTHAGVPKELREKAKITDGLVRLSVGIEDVDDLINGLEDGFRHI